MREMIEQIHKQEADPWKKVDSMIDVFSEKILRNTSFHKIMYREMSLDVRSTLSAVICDILSRNALEFSKIIEDGIAKKVFRKVDVPLTVGSILGTINQSTMSKNLVCKVLGVDPATYEIRSQEHITRVRKHLKQMMRAYLSIPENMFFFIYCWSHLIAFSFCLTSSLGCFFYLRLNPYALRLIMLQS